MNTVRQACRPRPEVLKGDLEDAIFAADFGHVIEGIAPDVYKRPEVFFRNTYPTAQLKKVVATVFDRLGNPQEAGAALRLSTGFGGGKTHTLIALYHLARHIDQPTLGTDLLPAAGRPAEVHVGAVDARSFGNTVCITHQDVETHSLWGELAYQLGGAQGYRAVADLDSPANVPSAGQMRALFRPGPNLLLLDELVMYMCALSAEHQRALLTFLASLVAECQARPQTVLVLTDTAGQAVYEREAQAIANAAAQAHAAETLGAILARRVSDFDPIADEGAEVINRRLFEHMDRNAPQEVSAEYYAAYQRIAKEHAGALPPGAATREYAERIVRCYPFHPRLVDTARDRLSALQDFNQTRGVLRLFARIMRDIEEHERDLYLISAGDVNWESPSLQADLLTRLGRDRFRAAVDADVRGHARELDEEYQTDVHRRVAGALLLESLPLNPNAAMDKADLGLATLRPTDVGHEPGEALDRLMATCWHTYRDETHTRYQFRYEPNAMRIIDERAGLIPQEDARGGVLTVVQNHYRGNTFRLIAWPASAKAVPDSSQLKLVLAETAALGQEVCDRQDTTADGPIPRRFRNAILALAPSPEALDKAIADRRLLMAAEQIARDERQKMGPSRQRTPLLEEVEDVHLTRLRTDARRSAVNAFDRLLFQGRGSLTLDERYRVSAERPLQDIPGQTGLMDCLVENGLIYKPGERLDVDLLVDTLLPGATPSLDHEGAVLASAVHERALESPRLRLLLNEEPVRGAVLEAVRQGKLAVRLKDGSAYDSDGCVSGPEGARVRERDKRLSTLNLTADVLLAPMDAPCVPGWFRVRAGGEPGTRRLLTVAQAAAAKQATEQQVQEAVDLGVLNSERQDDEVCVVDDDKFAAWTPTREPRESERKTVRGWGEALRHADARPLERLVLKADSLAGAKLLAAAAQPFGAPSVSLEVAVHGDLTDGGHLHFLVTDAGLNGALKPVDMAERLLRATTNESQSVSASLTLDFGEAPPTDTAPRFAQAKERAAGKVQVEATFGPEARGYSGEAGHEQ